MRDNHVDDDRPMRPPTPESIIREHARTAQRPVTQIYQPLPAEDPRAQKQAKVPLVQGCLNRFPLALMEVAKVSVFGAEKYDRPVGDMSYLGEPNAAVIYLDAEGRHAIKEAIEGPINHEDGDLFHKAQKAWNALADLEVFLRGRT